MLSNQMKIKYLKEAPQAKEGDVAEVEALYANAFIAMGYAELYEDTPTANSKDKAKTNTTKKEAPKKTTTAKADNKG